MNQPPDTTKQQHNLSILLASLEKPSSLTKEQLEHTMADLNLDFTDKSKTTTEDSDPLDLTNEATPTKSTLESTLLQVIDDQADLDISIATSVESTFALLARFEIEFRQGTSNASIGRTCKDAIAARPGVSTQFAFPGSDHANKRLFTLPTSGAAVAYWMVTALIAGQMGADLVDMATVFRAARTLTNTLGKTDTAMAIASSGLEAGSSLLLLEQAIEAEEKRRKAAEIEEDEEDDEEEAKKDASLLVPGLGSLQALEKILKGEENDKYETPGENTAKIETKLEYLIEVAQRVQKGIDHPDL